MAPRGVLAPTAFRQVLPRRVRRAAVFKSGPNISYDWGTLECLFKPILFQRYRVGIKLGVGYSQEPVHFGFADRQIDRCGFAAQCSYFLIVSGFFAFHVARFSSRLAEFLRTFMVYLRSPEVVSTRLDETT